MSIIWKHLAILGVVMGLLAMFATLAMANVLADASATADCKGRSLNVGATDLTPGTPHNINYSPSEGCGGNSSWTGSWSSTPTYVCTTPSVTATELVSIVVTPANGSIVKGAAQQFTATGTFSDNSTQNVTSSVTWSSTDTAVATINSTGLASGVAAGHTSIQPTSGSASGSPRLNVTLPAVGGIDSNATTNGACNAPASSCTTHATSAPARKETIMIIAWWAGQSLTATASDRGVNFYIPIVGPTNVPSTLIKAEVWYAVNRGAPTSFTVTLSGNSTSGAFDGIFIQVISMTGLNHLSPLDTATIQTKTGTGATLSVTSGTPAVANEMIWGIFLCPFPGTAWTVGSGWTSVSGQEAVSQSIYQNISSGPVVTPNVIASTSVNWIGFAIGFK